MTRTLDFSGNSPYGWLEMHARMLYPNDEDSYIEYFSIRSLDTELNSMQTTDGIIKIPRGIVLSLLHAPSKDEVFKKAAVKHYQGEYIGYAVYILKKMHDNGHKASLNKAYHIASKELDEYSNIFDNGVGKSKKKFWDYWDEFRDVAHFWAAIWQFRHATNLTTELDKNYKHKLSNTFETTRLAGNDSELLLFLPIANKMLTFLKGFSAISKKDSIVDISTVWIPDKSIKLGDIEIKTSPLWDRHKEIISCYIADNYAYKK